MKLITFDRTKKNFIEEIENQGFDVEFTAECEDIDPRNHCEVEDAKYIIEQLNNGNDAAWFSAKVEISGKGFYETDYLGGCSYKSFKEFKESDYFADMIESCIDEINRRIESINYGIKRRLAIRRASRILAPFDLHIVDTLSISELKY